MDKQWDYIGMMIQNPDPLPLGNASDGEVFRLTGTLPTERIERLIDIAGDLGRDDLDPACLDDAKGSYPDEGFLSDMKARMAEVAQRCRGRNRDDLNALIAALDDLEMMVHYESEFGRSVIADYQRALKRQD